MRLFGRFEKSAVLLIADMHWIGLYIYGMLHRPVITAVAAMAWMMVTLYYWPDSGEE